MDILEFSRANAKLGRILKRSITVDPAIVDKVRLITSAVRDRGQSALAEFTLEFDGYDCSREPFILGKDHFDACRKRVDPAMLALLSEARDNIRTFHEKQVQPGWIADFGDGVALGQRITPLDRVGLYVPGGKAFYPSTVLMNAVPAQVAGVREIIVATPPRNLLENAEVGAVLSLLGIERAHLMGGAQAIAAMAYGTEWVPRVDKIVGPGNIWVSTAKREVFGQVDIDMFAGPSEIAVLADDSANPAWVALDLLSQAEHGTGYESAILVTDSPELAKQVKAEVERLLSTDPREAAISKIIEEYGAIILVKDMEEGCGVINTIAPEHLEIVTRDPERELALVRHAGAIFLGPYSSEPVGDYWAGPNHVLPTGGTARFFSPLGVYDFVKRSSIINYSKAALDKHADKIARFADSEGLTFHGRAVMARKTKP